jgi:hypothetical protein
MFRSLMRSGVVALFVLVLAAPAQALPLTGAGEDFSLSLPEIWDRFIQPILGLWTEDSRAICDPNGGGCRDSSGSGGSTDSRAICDPNGGNCNS